MNNVVYELIEESSNKQGISEDGSTGGVDYSSLLSSLSNGNSAGGILSGTGNLLGGITQMASGISNMVYNWSMFDSQKNYLNSQTDLAKQQYDIQSQLFSDYKEERQRTKTIRNNVQSQYSSGSSISTSY